MLNKFWKRSEITVQVTVFIEKDGDVFYAHSPTMPGVHVEGETEAEVKQNVKEAATAYLMSLIKHNDPLPIGTTILQPPRGESFTFTQYLPANA
jgi:predicted RNase H-like HicB family nuclease